MIKPVLKLFFRLVFRVRLNGQQPASGGGKLLVVANHESFLDGLLLGLFLPFRATFVVCTTVLCNFWFRLILTQVPYLAVDPISPLAMKKVIMLLEAGEPVVIFSEGRITLTGSLMKVYDGPGFIAARTGATILPVRLDGPARSYFSRLSGNYPRSLFPRITLSFLQTTAISMPDAPAAKLRRRMAGEAMRRLMQEMLFKSHPVQTLFSAFLDAIRVHGRNTRLLEDMQQQEESYGELLTRILALGRMVKKNRRTRRGGRRAAAQCQQHGLPDFRHERSVRGPNVMLGYYLFDNPGVLTPPANGWYSTGDVVEIDTDGFVTILGRVKRFAKVADEMVSLETVEQIAHSASPGGSHAAPTQAAPQRGENVLLYTADANLTRGPASRSARTRQP